jgi:hypothetical protein
MGQVKSSFPSSFSSTHFSCRCCLSVDDQIRFILQKFQIHSLNNLQSNEVPQLISGRIMSATASASATMTSPIKENQCVYYQAQVYEYSSGDKEWIHRFTEIQWEDFILYDPDYPQHRLLVPTRKIVMRGHLLLLILPHISSLFFP